MNRYNCLALTSQTQSGIGVLFPGTLLLPLPVRAQLPFLHAEAGTDYPLHHASCMFAAC